MTSYYGYARNSGIPKVTGYADALARWENTKPVRGRENQNLRPLGHRNRSYGIARDEHTKDMVLYLWSEREVVRFKPDGDVVISAGGYITSSVTNFLSDVFSYWEVRSYVFDHSNVLSLHGQDAECRLDRGKTVTIRRGEDKNYHFVGGNNTYHTSLRRKEMNELRKKATDFVKYALGMCKLQECKFEVDGDKEYLSLGYWQRDTEAFAEGMGLTIQRILNTDEDTKYEGWNEALHTVVNSFGKYIYNYGNKPKRGITPKMLKNSVDIILMGAHRDKALERTPVTGSIKRDKYKGFFTDARWIAYHASKGE